MGLSNSNGRKELGEEVLWVTVRDRDSGAQLGSAMVPVMGFVVGSSHWKAWDEASPWTLPLILSCSLLLPSLP